MTFVDPMIWTLLAVSGLSITLCILPLLLRVDFSNRVADHADVLEAFDSVGLKVALGSCISLSIPLLLEIGRDCSLAFSSRIKNNILTNIFLVWSLIIPDLILFAYVLPYHDLRFFICLNQGRGIALVSSIYAYLILFGGEFFQRSVHMCWYLLCIASSLLFLWEAFGSPDPEGIKFTISTFCMLLCMGIFVFVTVIWFRRQAHTLRLENRNLSTDEYCCNIYMISSIICFSGVILTWLVFGRPRFGHMSSEYLIMTNIIYALFYVVISVFQGGAVRRDEIINVGILQVKDMNLFSYSYLKCSVQYKI